MALEALGIASNVAGLVDLGLSVCHGLWTYYESWRDAENDMKKMYSSIEALTKTFAVLKSMLIRASFDAQTVERVEESIRMCEDGIQCLRKKLNKVRATSPTGSRWNTKAKAHLQRALYPFKESTLAKLKEISSELQSHLQLALSTLQVDSSAMSLQALDCLSNDMNQVSLGIDSLKQQQTLASSHISELTANQKDQYLPSVHEWVSPLFGDFSSKQGEVFGTTARQDGLGHWLLNSAEYQRWLSGTGATIWCIGSRGVGKTVLASFLIDTLQRTMTECTAIAFIYCNYNDPQRQNPLNIVGCILQQLMLQKTSVADEVTECFEKHRKTKTPPSILEYAALLQSAIGHFSKTIIVIDALDECSDETRDVVLEEIRKLQPGISLLVTSRHALNVLSENQSSITVKLEANDMDIRKYLEERVNKSKVMRAHIAKDVALYDYLVSSIVGKAKGMFLLARLQLDSLMAKPNLRKIRLGLKCLPEELDSMYDQTFERIRKQDPEFATLALKLLYWVHHAIRPLHVQELRHALAVENGDSSFDEEGLLDKEMLESICGGMITLQENDNVGLVHYTAQEYLKHNSSSLFPGANTAIAHTCLTYLSFDDFQQGPCNNDESFEIRCTNYPLLRYASQHWVDHVNAFAGTGLEDTIIDFLAQEDKLTSAVQAMQVTKSRYPDWSQEYTKDVDGLWLASSHGLYNVCTILIGQGASVSFCDSHGQTPLHRAAICGFVEVGELLLDNNALLEAKSHDHGRTPLHWATWHGHQAIARSLLAKGANPEARDKRNWTPLHLAASRGYDEVTALLLDQRVDVNARDSYGATALYRAAEGGHDGAVRLLLDKEAHMDIQNDYDQTALHRAADLGHLAVTRLLLERGAVYDLKDYYGWTPLYRAADHGHYEVASLLADFAEAARKASHSRP